MKKLYAVAALCCLLITGAVPSLLGQNAINPIQSPLWLFDSPSTTNSGTEVRFFSSNGTTQASTSTKSFEDEYYSLTQTHSSDADVTFKEVLAAQYNSAGNLLFAVIKLDVYQQISNTQYDNNQFVYDQLYIMDRDGFIIELGAEWNWGDHQGPGSGIDACAFADLPYGMLSSPTGTCLTNYGRVSITPKPGSCNQYYIVTFADNKLLYWTIDTSDPDIPSFSPTASSAASITSTAGSIAIGQPVSSGNQRLYLAVPGDSSNSYSARGIYQFNVSSTGIAPINDSHIITGSDFSSSFLTEELELSKANDLLAWGDYNGSTIFAAFLSSSTGGYIGRATSQSGATTPQELTYINGIEIYPGNPNASPSVPQKIYVTGGTDNDGRFYKLTESSGTFSVFTEITIPNSWEPFESDLEATYNGYIAATTTDKILLLNPVTDAFGSSLSVTVGRKLPRQIDGWHYNFAGNFEGFAEVQVTGSGANPNATFQAPVLPGASYSWSVSCLQASITSGGTSSAVIINFGSTASVACTVSVVITHTPSQCTTSTQTTISRVINTTSGTGGGNGRLATKAVQVEIYPNPAQDWCQVKVAEDQTLHLVAITDLSGRQVRQFYAADMSESRIPLKGLNNGLYLVTVQTNTGSQTVHRLVVSK